MFLLIITPPKQSKLLSSHPRISPTINNLVFLHKMKMIAYSILSTGSNLWATLNERENQLLLNYFSRWCQWASMIIRVYKCAVFGIKKFSTNSLQFQPRLLINSKVVPPVKQSASFKYLGCFFNFDMNNKDHKDLALSNLQTMLTAID